MALTQAERSARYRARHREKVQTALKRWNTDNGLYCATKSYRDNAKKRDLVFELSDDQVRTLFSGVCHYCGAKPVPDKNAFIRNGIDRLNNEVGYVWGNVVSCCSLCNNMKKHLPIDLFVTHVSKIVKHMNSGA